MRRRREPEVARDPGRDHPGAHRRDRLAAGIDPRLVVADLATGWLFIGGGFVVWVFRPANRMGVLLIATGATWFVATFYPPAAFLYLGPLVHLLIAHPTGRVAGRTSRVVVAAVYIACAVAAVIPLTGILLAV